MHSQPESTQPRTAPVARLLAVLALVAATIVIAVVVIGSVGGSDDTDGGRSGRDGGGSEPARDYYVLQPGDTLSTVADKFGIGEGKIQELNPNLDPQTLPPQGCVDLVPDGCKKLETGG
jgi:LysM repeat protein